MQALTSNGGTTKTGTPGREKPRTGKKQSSGSPSGKTWSKPAFISPKDPSRGARLTPFPRNKNPFCRGKARRETHPPDP